MSLLLTTRAEVVTDDGRRATLDLEGWHSSDRDLLEQLRQAAPIQSDQPDALAATVQLAVRDLGVRVVLVKRRDPALVGAASKLYRALSTTSLQRAIRADPASSGPGATTRYLRAMGAVRRHRWLLIAVAGVAACLAVAYLLD